MTARLVQVGGQTVVLPWLPTTHEVGGLAPGYAETARPGRAPLQTRSSDPVPTLRIEYVARERDLREPITVHLAEVAALAKGKPLVRLVIGSHDYGAFQVVDAGYSVTVYAADGSPARAEVMVDLRASVTAVAKIGPVKPKGKGKGKGSRR